MITPSPSDVVRRCALVTGAGSGIGRATTLALTAQGIDCCLIGRTAATLESVAAACAGHAGNALTVVGDVTDTVDRGRAVNAAIDSFGRLDILVNNAGYSIAEPIVSYSGASWREVMAVSLESAAFLAQLAIPAMRREHWGRIVNVTSVYGFLALNGHFYRTKWSPADEGGPVRGYAYAAAKGGLRTLTRELAAAVGRDGITVNAVAPGMIQTEAVQIEPERVEAFAEATPVGRVGTPNDVAHAISFLVAEGAGFITGHELVVDGGWSIW